MPEALRYWIRRLAGFVYRREDWLLIAHAARLEPPSRALPDGARLLKGEQLRLGYGDRPQRDSRIARRLAEGLEIGLGVELGGRLVYDTWIRPGAYLEPNTGLRLDPGPRGGVLLDSWTDPAARGRGLHSAMLERRLHEAGALGLERLEGLVFASNRPALRAQRDGGAEALKWYIRRRLFGLAWTTERTADWHELDLD